MHGRLHHGQPILDLHARIILLSDTFRFALYVLNLALCDSRPLMREALQHDERPDGFRNGAPPEVTDTSLIEGTRKHAGSRWVSRVILA